MRTGVPSAIHFVVTTYINIHVMPRKAGSRSTIVTSRCVVTFIDIYSLIQRLIAFFSWMSFPGSRFLTCGQTWVTGWSQIGVIYVHPIGYLLLYWLLVWPLLL